MGREELLLRGREGVWGKLDLGESNLLLFSD
jgi:hypothetical protein